MARDRLTVRRAAEEDAPAIVLFNLAMALETEEKELSVSTLERGVSRALQGQDDTFYLVAEVDHRVVGMLMVTDEWSDWRDGRFWWLQSVYVHPDFRRQGVFRRLFTALQSAARSDPDVCGLRLYVERDNRAAQDSYQALGMQRTPYRVFEIEFE